MTADEFTNKVDGMINDFIDGATNETEFKHAIQDILIEVVYKNEDLRNHYYKQFEQDAKAWEYQNLVHH